MSSGITKKIKHHHTAWTPEQVKELKEMVEGAPDRVTGLIAAAEHFGVSRNAVTLKYSRSTSRIKTLKSNKKTAAVKADFKSRVSKNGRKLWTRGESLELKAICEGGGSLEDNLKIAANHFKVSVAAASGRWYHIVKTGVNKSRKGKKFKKKPISSLKKLIKIKKVRLINPESLEILTDAHNKAMGFSIVTLNRSEVLKAKSVTVDFTNKAILYNY